MTVLLGLQGSFLNSKYVTCVSSDTDYGECQGQATFAVPGTISRLICRLSISEVLFAHTLASRDFLPLRLCAFPQSVLGSGDPSWPLDDSLREVGTEMLHI